MKPTLGRIVHYTLSRADVASILKDRTEAKNQAYGIPVEGETYAGIVVRVRDESVDLKLFLGSDDFYMKNAGEATDEKPLGGWSWPPREDYSKSGDKDAKKVLNERTAGIRGEAKTPHEKLVDEAVANNDGKPVEPTA